LCCVSEKLGIWSYTSLPKGDVAKEKRRTKSGVIEEKPQEVIFPLKT
jgi:hypothetical protein